VTIVRSVVLVAAWALPAISWTLTRSESLPSEVPKSTDALQVKLVGVMLEQTASRVPTFTSRRLSGSLVVRL
jgi:hypothetical protein